MEAEPSKRKRRWYQFSLRTLLIFTTAAAIVCGWLGSRLEKARGQKAAVAAILKDGGRVTYDYEIDATGKHVGNAEPHAPKWLLDALGEDSFISPVEITVCSDASAEYLSRLTALRSLDFTGPRVTDSGLQHAEGLKQLKTVVFKGTHVSGTGLRHLEGLNQLNLLFFYDETVINSGSVPPDMRQLTVDGLRGIKGLKQIRRLMLSGRNVTDAGMESLRGFQLTKLELDDTLVGDRGIECLRDMSHLESLWLFKSQVTDAALNVIKDFRDLKDLSLCGSQVTDAGIEQLNGLKNLQRLDLKMTRVSEGAAAKLSEALRHCKIDTRP